MTQYNSLNVKLSNSQLNKLKSAIKNETDVVLRISSNMVVTQVIILIFLMKYYQLIDKLQIFVKLLLITYQPILNFQLSKMIQSGGFFGKVLGPLLKTGLPIMKSAIKP